MARATVKNEKVEVKTFVNKPVGVTLELTIEEARTIQSIVGHIRGDTRTSLRAHTSRIYRALDDAGIRGTDAHPWEGGIPTLRDDSLNLLDKPAT